MALKGGVQTGVAWCMRTAEVVLGRGEGKSLRYKGGNIKGLTYSGKRTLFSEAEQGAEV